MELVSGAVQNTKAQAVEPQDALQVGEQHLHLLPSPGAVDKGVGAGGLSNSLPRMFVDVASDLPGRLVRRTSRLQRAPLAVSLARVVAPEAVLADAGAWPRHGAPVLLQLVPTRAGVFVGLGIEDDVGSRKGHVQALGLVDDRDVRLDHSRVEPAEHLSGTICRIRRQKVGVQPEAVAHPFDHRAGGTDLCLPDCTAGLDVQDNRAFAVDQVVGRIGEEDRTLLSADPLRRRVCIGDELRLDFTGSADRRIVDRVQVFLHGRRCDVSADKES